MNPKLLKVKTPGKMLFIKGRLVRTPLEDIIRFETELNLLKSSLVLQGIEFEIIDYVPIEVKHVVEPVIVEEVKVKKVIDPKSILGKLAAEDE